MQYIHKINSFIQCIHSMYSFIRLLIHTIHSFNSTNHKIHSFIPFCSFIYSFKSTIHTILSFIQFNHSFSSFYIRELARLPQWLLQSKSHSQWKFPQNFTLYPIKPKEDFTKFSVCKHITADSKVTERLQRMRRG